MRPVPMFESRSRRGVLDTTLCDKLCFFPGTPVSSTNKTVRRYSCNIFESGVKHHNPIPLSNENKNNFHLYDSRII